MKQKDLNMNCRGQIAAANGIRESNFLLVVDCEEEFMTVILYVQFKPWIFCA